MADFKLENRLQYSLSITSLKLSTSEAVDLLTMFFSREFTDSVADVAVTVLIKVL